MVARRAALLGFTLLLVACQPGDVPPPRGDYTLTWYRHEGTDYGTVIPGFSSLQFCRQAGTSMTMDWIVQPEHARAALADEHQAPWFECGNGCRPYSDAASILRVCHQIAEFLRIDGRVIDVCGTAPCHAAGWTGP